MNSNSGTNYLTCFREDHTEGFGSVYQDFITAWVICRLFKINYLHKRPEYIHHYKSNNCTLEKYIDDWENLFGFLKKYYRNELTEITETLSDRQLNPEFINKIKNFDNKPRVYNNLFTRYMFDRIGRMSDMVKDELYTEFHNGILYQPKNNYFKNSDNLKVAIHIRNLNSEDLMRESVNWEYFSVNYSDNLNQNSQTIFYNKLINLISEKNKGNTIEFHIFSQGTPEQFAGINGSGVTNTISIHLNEYAVDDFWHLVKADILVLAKSSFSYLAALLNPGVKIFKGTSFRHYLPSETVYVDDDAKIIRGSL